MPNIAQSGRQGQLITPLGEDVLSLVGFDGVEGLSELFEYRVEALSERDDIDFDKALGRNCALKFKSPDGPERYFNGVLVEARAVGAREDLFVYQLILRPWLWLLSHTADCRIWHEKTALDIIKEVFHDRGFTDFNDATTTTSYPKLEYCVQYREKDLDFVSRLMEQHGIYYYFKHSAENHVLTIADAKSSHKPLPGRAKINYFPRAHSRRDQEHFHKWSAERRFRTGKYELNDYDFKKPGKDLTARKQASSSYQKGSMEIYDYPGEYVENSDGDAYADVRLKAEQALDRRRYAEGNAIGVFPGALTNVEKVSPASENTEYLVVRASHSFAQQAYRSGSGGEADYSGAFELLDSNIPFKAPLATPKPRIYGPQTAKVVGKDGEEIDVDDYGRILVLFHWDRKKQKSCRLRVAQLWAGKQWGGQVIPRIGMEVVVEFLEGDPDRPLVVGTVYNGDNKFPYGLPDHKTQSGMKSDSSVGHSGYNEFMFEDKKNGEKIKMHAQKDHDVVVLNQEQWKIGEQFMGGGASRSTLLVNGGDDLTINRGDKTTTLMMGNETTTLTMGSQTTTLAMGSQTTTLTMGGQTTTLALGNQTLTLGGGNQIVTINGNQLTTCTMNIVITALQSIELICGASVIAMTPLGIVIASPTTVVA